LVIQHAVAGTGQCETTCLAPVTANWLRLARIARLLSWLTLGWLGIEAGGAIGAAVIAGSAALLGFGLDSGIEAMASLIVIWRFTGTRLASATSERRAQQLVAVSFFLLAPYIAVEATRVLAAGDRAGTSPGGLVLTAGTAIFEPALGLVKRRIGARLGSAATAGEGTQNLLCACLAIAVFAGLAAQHPYGASGGSTALSRSGSPTGRWPKGGGRWPGDHASAHASQERRADHSPRAGRALSNPAPQHAPPQLTSRMAAAVPGAFLT
jgi:hypothetical protein